MRRMLLIATFVFAIIYSAVANGTILHEDFTSSTLEPSWQVMSGQGSYSLTTNPGFLRYNFVGPMTTAGDIGGNGWVPSLRLVRSFPGSNWVLTTKANYNLKWQGSGSQIQEFNVVFRDSGNNRVASIGFTRGVDEWYNYNALNSSLVINNTLVAGGNIIPLNTIAPPVDSWVRQTIWLQIVRTSDTASLRYSLDGTNYTEIFTAPFSLETATQEARIAATVWTSAGSYTDYDYLYVEPSNMAPSVDAGENLDITSDQEASTTISGTAKDGDPGDVLTCRWLEGGTVLLDWTPVGPAGECSLDLAPLSLPVGTHTLTLEASDTNTTASDEMILTIGNSAPHVAVSGGGTYEIGAAVSLTGDVSDFDGDTVDYRFLTGGDVFCAGTVATIVGGEPVPIPDACILSNLPPGEHTVFLQVDDGINAPANTETIVKIVDNTAPTISPVLNKTILWPPDHRMVDMVINANASDNSGKPCHLDVLITCDEPQEGLGDGDMPVDWTCPVIDEETGAITFQLRSERSGSGDGRKYTISVIAIDAVGNTSTSEMKVSVPHDQKKK